MGRETSACVFLAVLATAEVNPRAARAGVDAAAAPAPAKIDAGAPAALTEGIDRLAAEAIAQGKLPGCVVAVGRAGGIVYQTGFRVARALARQGGDDPGHDLRSGLAHQAHRHRDRADGARGPGQDHLDERVHATSPNFAPHGKEAISIRQLSPTFRACPPKRLSPTMKRPRDGVEAHHGTSDLRRRPAARASTRMPVSSFSKR